ncbi:DUF805 domain-containing protein [Asticcacaulis sp. AC402]|uniref:DUF805 domain-containing protein n=1 Tax=Asticcacaulis sp. AC402 TaxID=1282361 RepID=UPI0003C3DFAE|nr:DUF805 domain-containing protein [Asticcacaulis sp. AC402]ESQ75609.1 hypothetical protein ABAC402_08780 [Asticcacaulis sp. AC402]
MRLGVYVPPVIRGIFHPGDRIDRLTFFYYGLILILIQYVFPVLLLGPGLFAADLPTGLAIFRDSVQMVIGLVVLYGQFCLYAKRLHDINLPAIVAMLLFSGLFVELFLPVTAADFDPMTAAPLTWQATAVSLVDKAVTVGQLFLLIIPGLRRPNRYGFSSSGIELPRSKPLEG